MIFADLFFLYVFIPLLIIFYSIAYYRDKKQVSLSGGALAVCNDRQNIALVVFSLIFYAWGEPKFVFIMLISILFNWVFGLLISHSSGLRGVLPTYCIDSIDCI